jgi:DNA repair photolyase
LKAHTKGRGAQKNTPIRFESTEVETFLQDALYDPEILSEQPNTTFTKVYPKSIVNRVDSPDVPANWSMNPYQGCEHGCIYCYARVTHEYWGYSAGKDFEKEILVKVNAAELLEKRFKSKSWSPEPIMLSGNTDCYQPAERTFKITRSLLEVCLKYQHPVGIITKNALVLRDLDILKQLAKLNLVKVVISLTTLDEELRRTMEPRTSSSANRLKAIEILSEKNIPVSVMMAPVIPGLNSTEIFSVAEAAEKAGAKTLHHTMVRLNGAIALLFEDWINKALPLKAKRVTNLIAEAQGGKLGNSKFGERMSGKGVLAQSIQQQIELAKIKYNLNHKLPAYNLNLFDKKKTPQLRLF